MQTIVIKYGGSVRDEPTFLLEEIADYASEGHRIVVVHGGGPEITQYLARLGCHSAFENGQRVTDAAALDVVEMVLAGRVGKRLVRALQAFGACPVGISGEDGSLIRALPYSDDERLGFVGRVDQVDISLLNTLLAGGFLPVVAPLGLDATGSVRNINADFVAGAIAGALHADTFILATDVPGVKETSQSAYAIRELTVEAALRLIDEAVVTGGMVPKVLAAIEAVCSGAQDAYIVDGRQDGILDAVLRKDRIGTRIAQTDQKEMRHA
ncbi:MAG: acetylglutamate kinase [Firmicutes bacterium]|nr:acetylglutamate kinase [Bacillota bacterium]